MEHLYNPDRMTEEEIKRTFVARQRVIDELVSLVERQPQGAGVQHVVVVAPRGMGKTTILLMAQFAIRDRGLSSQWQTVRFAEESYGVTSLADFWLQAIRLLSEEVGEPELQAEAEELAREFRKDDELQEAAFALLKDWSRQHGKRLALLVDNFDMILEQINDEQENARLRNVLMNDGTIMLIGGATTFFREARAYDQPLYNFFKIIHLDNLKFEEMQDLLRQRAELDALPNFEATLRANRTRLKVLQYFTGGNPRLVLMLYRIINSSEVVDVKRGLEQLLDQVTPYYKAKLESLPPQQRKILDHIAKISAETNEGLTPTQIAEATRSTPNAVSTQLKRLSEQGYVRSANLRGRNAFYTLSEPLYAIWHQMRFGRNARQKMQWLVSFLKNWYGATELGTESKRLEVRFQELLQTGLMQQARQVLEHRFYVVEAMSGNAHNSEMNGIIGGFLNLQDFSFLKNDILPPLNLKNLSVETINALSNAHCIDREEAGQAITMILENLGHYGGLPGLDEKRRMLQGLETLRLGCVEVQANRTQSGLDLVDKALIQSPELRNSVVFWQIRAKLLNQLGRYEEALTNINYVLDFNTYRCDSILIQCEIFINLQQYDQAAEKLTYVFNTEHDNSTAFSLQGRLLDRLGRTHEALSSFAHTVTLSPTNLQFRFNYAVSLTSNFRLAEAVAELNLIIKSTQETELTEQNRLLIDGCKSLLDSLIAPLDNLIQVWDEFLETETNNQTDNWRSSVFEELLSWVLKGRGELVRPLIDHSDVDGVLLPLRYVLDCMKTNDKTQIEKLSPEVRNIVEEIVEKLRCV